MTLFTFRRSPGGTGTRYLSRYGIDANAETPHLEWSRQFRDSTEFRAWHAEMDADGQRLFEARRWSRVDLHVLPMSPGIAAAADPHL